MNMESSSLPTDTSHNEFFDAVDKQSGDREDIVLVVDDYEDIRQLVVHDIQKSVPQLRIYEAGNGIQALALIDEIRITHEREPNLMVLDLQMREMDGWDIIEKLKKQYLDAGQDQGIPIVVMSYTEGSKGRIFKKPVPDARKVTRSW